MTKFLILLLSCSVIGIHAQEIKKRDLSELIIIDNPGWDQVQNMISRATNLVEVLPKDSIRADSALFLSQVTTNSSMGGIIFETGGLLIDNGWIRILGSGSEELDRGVMDWNKNKSFIEYGEQPTFLLIADDVLGGFFAINAGGLDPDNLGKVFYFAPDTMLWENLDFGYSQFLMFCFTGDLNLYYEGLRWSDWKNDVSEINGDQGFSCFPFLWSEEGRDIDKVKRNIIPIQELWDQYFIQLEID